MFFVTGGELEYWNNTETDTGRNVFGQVCVVIFFFSEGTLSCCVVLYGVEGP